MASKLPFQPETNSKKLSKSGHLSPIKASIEALLDVAHRADFALKAGSQAVDFCLPNIHGKQIALSRLLLKGPVILLVSHGPWCGTVRERLEALGSLHAKIASHPASVLAIAPSWKLHTHDESDEKHAPITLPFELLVDVGSKVAGQFGLTFTPEERLHSQYQELGYCDPQAKVDDPLLIPATYVIGRSGQIAFAFIDSDPDSFLEPQTLVRLLENLSSRPDF